ncbi:MAG: Uma2 family endonuclease [Acidimicrobiales bacterium]
MSVTTRMTVDEFLAHDWPRGTQLIAGEVVVNQPKLPHQSALGFLHTHLWLWCRAEPGRGYCNLSVDVRLGDHDLYGPDVWWVAEERRPPPEAVDLDGVPDLIVEVRSPSTWRFDIGPKKTAYEAAGVAELWLVDTFAPCILVYRRSSVGVPHFDIALELAGDDRLVSPLLPGFAVPVKSVFGS